MTSTPPAADESLTAGVDGPGAATAERVPFDRATAVLLPAICLVAFGLRAYRAETASFWFDESSSWKTSQYAWSEIWTPISQNVHPPLYYLVLKAWSLVWGDGPLSLRLCSATFGVLSVLAAYGLVREVLQGWSPAPQRVRASALLAAALCAVSGVHVQAGVQARMYPLGTFLTLVSGWAAIRVWQDGGSVGSWVALTAAATGLSLTHYYGLFTAAALGLWLVGVLAAVAVREGWTPRTRRLATGAVASAWGAANVWGLWLPYFLAQRDQVTDNYFIPPFEWSQLARMCAAQLTSPEQYGRTPTEIGWLACGAWVAVCLAAAAFGGGAGRLAALGAIAPPACGTVYCLTVRSIFHVRYFLFAQTWLLIAWVLLLARLPSRLGIGVLGAASLAWCGYWTALHLQARDRSSAEHGLRDAVALLDEWRTPQDVVVVGQGVIHPTVQQYTRLPRERVFVVDRGRPYPHYQGGPLLHEEEYLSVAGLESRAESRVFTVDVYDLWGRGSRHEVRLPADRWRTVRERWFQEGYGQPCRVFIREYERIQSATAQWTGAPPPAT